MIQIVYISSALAPWSTEQLLELLQQCLKNNSARGVTEPPRISRRPVGLSQAATSAA